MTAVSNLYRRAGQRIQRSLGMISQEKSKDLHEIAKKTRSGSSTAKAADSRSSSGPSRWANPTAWSIIGGVAGLTNAVILTSLSDEEFEALTDSIADDAHSGINKVKGWAHDATVAAENIWNSAEQALDKIPVNDILDASEEFLDSRFEEARDRTDSILDPTQKAVNWGFDTLGTVDIDARLDEAGIEGTEVNGALDSGQENWNSGLNTARGWTDKIFTSAENTVDSGIDALRESDPDSAGSD